jgi:hypothetical protein
VIAHSVFRDSAVPFVSSEGSRRDRSWLTSWQTGLCRRVWPTAWPNSGFTIDFHIEVIIPYRLALVPDE